MKHGDISNRQSPIIAFSLDSLLFREKTPEEDNLIGKLDDLFRRVIKDDKALFMNKPINEKFTSILRDIWNKYDYSIYLVTFHEEYVNDLHELLQDRDIVYTRLVAVETWEELRTKTHNQFTYYFDTDIELLSYLSSKSATHIDRIQEVIR